MHLFEFCMQSLVRIEIGHAVVSSNLVLLSLVRNEFGISFKLKDNILSNQIKWQERLKDERKM